MLINAPTAFGADLALTQQIPMADIVSRVSADPENFIVGVFDDDRLVGTTGAYREIMPKRRHLGEIWGVYVDPAHRGNALSARMLTMALEKLRDIGGIERVQLAVTAGNEAAEATYLKAGFTAYGIEPAATRVEGQDYDNILMQRLL